MWKEKGQNIIEYALMLALVVGIGSLSTPRGMGTTFPPFSTMQETCWKR